MAPTPTTAPETAPATPPSPADVAKIELRNATTDTAANLQRLKDQLKTEGITNENDPNVKAEIEELTRVFDEKKEAIKFITKAELKQLASAIKDTAPGGQTEKLEGTFEVKPDGELVFNETGTESASATPPAAPPEAPEVNLETIARVSIPERAQEEMAKYSPNAQKNWLAAILTGFKDQFLDFLAGFGLAEQVAQWRGFANAALEKKAEISYTMLAGEEGRSILDKSPLSDILILDHINKNELKKILAQYPTLDFSNKTNIEAAFLGKHADNPGLTKYHRIYEGMREMCGELSSPESIAYNPEERLKRLLSYSRKEEMDEMVDANKPSPIVVMAPVEIVPPVENAPTSPEAQTQDLIDARQLDSDIQKSQTALAAAKSISPETEESKKKVIEVETALKSSQEKMDSLKKYEKGVMLTALEDANKKLETLKAQKTVLESKEPKNTKEIAENQTQIDFYETNKAGIMEKIKSVMTTDDSNTEKWNFQDTKTASDIVTARIGIQSIMMKTPISVTVETPEDQEPETEKFAKEITILSQEIEQNAREYSEAHPNRKSALKKAAKDKLASLEEKTNTATAIDKTLQDDIVKHPEKARKSGIAMKQIELARKNAEKSVEKIETEGGSDLESLDPTDRNNLVYYDGKLYQTNLSSNAKGGYRYHEMFFDGVNLKQGTFGKTIEYKTNKELQEGGYMTISYGQANDTIRNLTPGQINKNSDDWIYVAPVHFSGKLRNIKIN